MRAAAGRVARADPGPGLEDLARLGFLSCPFCAYSFQATAGDLTSSIGVCGRCMREFIVPGHGGADFFYGYGREHYPEPEVEAPEVPASDPLPEPPALAPHAGNGHRRPYREEKIRRMIAVGRP